MEHPQPNADTLVSAIQWLVNAPGSADEHLLEVCFAVLTLEEMRSLQSISVEERMRWAEYIQSYQNPDSGLFGEHVKVESGEASALENMILGALRSTHFALNALSVLNTIALHRLRFTETHSSEDANPNWLNELGWTESLLTSERLMYLLGILIYRVEVEFDHPSAALYHQILDWLERFQDRKSGLWGLKEGAPLQEAIVAGCHLIPYFGYVNRPVMRISGIADCCLHLLKSNYSCLSDVSPENCYAGIAAMSLLSVIHQGSTYQRDEITEALNRSLHALQNPPVDDRGIFSEAQDERMLEVREQLTIYEEFRQNPFLLACVYQCAVSKVSSAMAVETRPSEMRAHRQPILGCVWSRNNSTPIEQSILQMWERPYHFPVQSARLQPRVSVVIPCYNLGIFLHEAIQSVLDQTFQDFEILIVDDGSKDEYTRWVLSQLDLPQTRVIQQENRGLAAARNAGIRLARGDYVCCLDPDDRLRPGYFAGATPILNTRPDVAIVTGWLKVFDEREADYVYEEFTFADLLANNQVITPALFRKSAWEQVGGYCETFNTTGIEDWDFWIRIYEAGYCAHLLPEVLYDYRIRVDAMSASMYEPDSWRRMIAELVQHHRAAYAEHLEVVLEKLNYKWADARNWALDLGRGLSWWERQSGVWQHEAEQGDRKIQILEDRILNLEGQIERSDLRQTMINELVANAGDQPIGLDDSQADEADKLRSLNNELLERVNDMEAERNELQKRLDELHRMNSDREWISPGKRSMGRAAWYYTGKRLGFIKSNPVDEEEPNDQP